MINTRAPVGANKLIICQTKSRQCQTKWLSGLNSAASVSRWIANGLLEYCSILHNTFYVISWSLFCAPPSGNVCAAVEAGDKYQLCQYHPFKVSAPAEAAKGRQLVILQDRQIGKPLSPDQPNHLQTKHTILIPQCNVIDRPWLWIRRMVNTTHNSIHKTDSMCFFFITNATLNIINYIWFHR